MKKKENGKRENEKKRNKNSIGIKKEWEKNKKKR